LKVRFLTRAAAEYHQAIEYYENQKQGLGLHFAAELDKTLARITVYPEAWQAVEKNVRRCLMDHFPYGILYAIEPEAIVVLSVMNLYRNPESFSTN
jgi:toxin ParE1/3/4